jgi:hypothetical protein
MIYLCTGKVGSGKTLLALTQMLGILGRGGCVVSNVALRDEGVDDYLWKHFRRRLGKGQVRFHDFEAEPDFRRSVPRGVDGCNVGVFCDEAQIYYNSVADTELKRTFLDLVKYVTQSRKMRVDLTFITQVADSVWKQFRDQALFEYRCRDMRVLSVPLFGKIFSGLRYSQIDIKSGQLLAAKQTKLSPDLFACYDTAQMYNEEMRDIFASAEIWSPLPKNHQEYAVIADCCGRHRSACVCGRKNKGLFRKGGG